MAEPKNEFFKEIKEEFKTIGTKVERLFDDLIKGDDGNEFELLVDVFETSDSYVFQADMPGLTKELVQLQVRDNNLTLKGERAATGEIGEVNYHKKERSSGAFRRSFNIPHGVEVEKIKAKFEHGVLTITFPKSEGFETQQDIDID